MQCQWRELVGLHHGFLWSGLPYAPLLPIISQVCLHSGLADMGLQHCRLVAGETEANDYVTSL